MSVSAPNYPAYGLRILPIRPGEKTPALNDWPNQATLDLAQIDRWLDSGHNIGAALGPLADGTWIFAVDIDGPSHGVDGEAALHDLEDAYSELPDTWEAITGGGGRHLLYRSPTEVRNGKLGDGVDIRGNGGQIVIAPSVHPSGQRYEWVDGHAPWEHELVDAPGWLVALATRDDSPGGDPTPDVALPERSRIPGTPDDELRPGDRFAAAVTWQQLLEPDGWTLHHTDRTGEQHWTRPGKNPREGTSATVGYKGSDVLKIFTSSIPHLDAEATYTKLGYLAATRFAGDHSAAARALAAAGHGSDTFDPVDWIHDVDDHQAELEHDAADEPAELDIRWVDTLDRHMPPEPPVIIDGLLRAGELLALGAPRAIGKTWLSYNLAIQLAQGHGEFLGHLPVRRQANVLYLQGELDQWGSATRWKLLTGIDQPLPHIAETFDRIRFRTLTSRTNYTTSNGTVTEEHHAARIDPRLEHAIVANNIDVVIVDPWAVYYAGNENSNDAVEAVLGELRAITIRTGVAWVIIHHITGKAERTGSTEPEDLWRGATRLADWASTRVTVLPHYTEAQRKEKGLTRRDARRIVDVHFLRRSTPTDDFSMRLTRTGWWEPWRPEDDDSDLRHLAKKLRAAGGTWSSMTVAADALGLHHKAATELVDIAERAGLVTVTKGSRGSQVIQLLDVDNPWQTGTGETA